MPATIVERLISVQGLLTLLGAMTLTAGGFALIASSYRTSRQELARRLELVRPTIPFASIGKSRRPSDDDPFHMPGYSMPIASRREIVRIFLRLGVSADRALTYFTTIRLGLGALLSAFVWFEVRHIPAFAASSVLTITVMAITAIVAWFVPKLFIDYNVRQRAKAVRAGLPDALELLVVCVEAGLSLEDGLARVVSELKRSQPALADELDLTLADLRILPNRDQALVNLADRVDVPSIRAVVTTLTQALRYGTPLAHSIRVVASDMRNDFLLEMEERANRLPAFLTLPVMLFLMPTIFLVVGGPAALRVIDAFHR
jgi:tight adherence protein C